MGFPFRGPADDPPRSESPPYIDLSSITVPVMCLWCARRTTIVLPDVHAGGGNPPAFCSVICAACFGVHEVMSRAFCVCNYCGAWTNDNGDCLTCDQIVALVDDGAASEVLADEAARKEVGHEA